jgi:hypothetical protein
MKLACDVTGVVKVVGKDSLCIVGEGSNSTKCLDLTQMPPTTWSNQASRTCVGNHHCTVNVSGAQNVHFAPYGLEQCCQ